MDKYLQHIKKWVKNKGIKIIMTDEHGSRFSHNYPNNIYISKHTRHGLLAAILHEYYHSQQAKRKLVSASTSLNINVRTQIEYRAELFVIRCFKKLGIIYDTTFINDVWKDTPADYYDTEDYYTRAYKLLIKYLHCSY